MQIEMYETRQTISILGLDTIEGMGTDKVQHMEVAHCDTEVETSFQPPISSPPLQDPPRTKEIPAPSAVPPLVHCIPSNQHLRV